MLLELQKKKPLNYPLIYMLLNPDLCTEVCDIIFPLTECLSACELPGIITLCTAL